MLVYCWCNRTCWHHRGHLVIYKIKKGETMSLKEYVAELGRCLIKESVGELDCFINKHQKELGRTFVNKWNHSGSFQQETIMYRMIYNRNDMPLALKNKAGKWLKDHKCKTTFF